MNSKNPFLRNKSFTNTSASSQNVTHQATVIDYNDSMTVSGTINKSFLMLVLLIASAAFTWSLTFSGYNAMFLTIGGAIVGLILVLIASFKPQYSTFLAPGYAIFEGLFIGGISAVFETIYPGIVIQAVGATFVTFMVCFALYKYEIVKVTEKFKSIVIANVAAITIGSILKPSSIALSRASKASLIWDCVVPNCSTACRLGTPDRRASIAFRANT